MLQHPEAEQDEPYVQGRQPVVPDDVGRGERPDQRDLDTDYDQEQHGGARAAQTRSW